MLPVFAPKASSRVDALGPHTKICEPIVDKAVMAVKTILMAPKSDIVQILDDEGIISVRTQEVSSAGDIDSEGR